MAREKGDNGFRYENCVEPSLVARMEELYIVVDQESNITNNTFGVSFARVVLVERKGVFKVKWVLFCS